MFGMLRLSAPVCPDRAEEEGGGGRRGRGRRRRKREEMRKEERKGRGDNQGNDKAKI